MQTLTDSPAPRRFLPPVPARPTASVLTCALLLTAACSEPVDGASPDVATSGASVQRAASAVTDPLPTERSHDDAAGMPPVTIRWSDAPRRWVRATALPLRAVVRNESAFPLAITASLRTAPEPALNAPRARTDASDKTYQTKLAPGDEQEFEFLASDLTIKSARVAREVLIDVAYTAPSMSERDGGNATAGHHLSSSRYVQFSKNFRRARVAPAPRPLKWRAKSTLKQLWKQAASRTQGKHSALVLSAQPNAPQEIPASFAIERPSTAPSPWFSGLPVEGPSGDVGYRICGHWRAAYNDADGEGGQDFMTAPGINDYPARYARATLMMDMMWRSHSSIIGRVWTGVLDADGCTPEVMLDPDEKYALYMEPTLETENGTITIEYGEDRPAGFMAYFTPGDSPGATVSVHPAQHDPVTRVAAVISHALGQPDPGIDWNLGVFADQICGDGTTACFSARMFIGPRKNGLPHNSTYKHVIAHELGHAVQTNNKGGVFGDHTSPDESELPAVCLCDHVDAANRKHCLQSQELLGNAIREGYGQFYAAKIFNRNDEEDCAFGYYKEYLDPDSGITRPVPNWHDCALPERHLDTHCAGDRLGVEHDWMLFFRFLHAEMDPPATIADIAAFTGESDITVVATWEILRARAEAHFGAGSSQYEQLVAAAALYGVDN